MRIQTYVDFEKAPERITFLRWIHERGFVMKQQQGMGDPDVIFTVGVMPNKQKYVHQGKAISEPPKDAIWIKRFILPPHGATKEFEQLLREILADLVYYRGSLTEGVAPHLLIQEMLDMEKQNAS